MLFYSLIILFLTLVYIAKIVKSKHNVKNLPPGPIRWWIIGNIPEMQMADRNYPHVALAKMANKYGDIMSFGFGVHYAVIVSSFEKMKEIFKTSEANYARFDFPYVLDRSFGKELGIIWSKGQNWSFIRNYTIKTMKEFGFGKPKYMISCIKKEVDDLVSSLKINKADTNDGIFEVDSNEFAVNAVNILWSFVANCRFLPDDPLILRNLEHNNLVAQIIGYKNIYSAFPFLKRLFPNWSQFNKHSKTNKEIQEFMKNIIKNIKNKRSMRVDNEPSNFVEKFLDDIEKNKNNPALQQIFTEEQLIVILADVFFAGSESISRTLNWTILLLAKYPEKQRKLQEEIKLISKDGSLDINTAHIERMPYTKAIMLEVFRIACLVPIPLPRCPNADIHTGKYTIPKGTMLMFNLYAIQYDQEFWGNDVKSFRPERFLDGTNKIINEYAERVASFGIGRRICPGENMTWDVYFMFICGLFQNFTFESLPGMILTEENPKCSLALSPQNYKIKIIPRSQML